jgi:hypothetical protein
MITAEEITQGLTKAHTASQKFFTERLGGVDQYACGFAWVDVVVDRTNSLQAKELLRAGFKRDHKPRTLSYWNPGKMPVQNIDTLEQGAMAFADHLNSLGLVAYASSRLD